MKTNKYKTLVYAAGVFVIITILVLFNTNHGSQQTYSTFNSVILLISSYIAMIYDINTRKIPNKIVLVMILIWVMIITAMMFIDTNRAITSLTDSIIGFSLGGGLFLLVYLLSKRGLGGGDVKFMAAAGLYLGFAGTIPTILYGTVLAALTGLTLILLKKIDRKDTIPFAPFLFIGIMITLIV